MNNNYYVLTNPQRLLTFIKGDMRKFTESYAEMKAKQAEYRQLVDANNSVHIAVLSATMRGNNKLDGLLNDFRHNLDDQMIDLKYGKGYKASFMELLTVAVGRL